MPYKVKTSEVCFLIFSYRHIERPDFQLTENFLKTIMLVLLKLPMKKCHPPLS